MISLSGVPVMVRRLLLQQKFTAKSNLSSVDPVKRQLLSGHREGETNSALSDKQTESSLLLLEKESERTEGARKTKQTETEGQRERERSVAIVSG